MNKSHAFSVLLCFQALRRIEEFSSLQLSLPEVEKEGDRMGDWGRRRKRWGGRDNQALNTMLGSHVAGWLAGEKAVPWDVKRALCVDEDTQKASHQEPWAAVGIWGLPGRKCECVVYVYGLYVCLWCVYMCGMHTMCVYSMCTRVCCICVRHVYMCDVCNVCACYMFIYVKCVCSM